LVSSADDGVRHGPLRAHSELVLLSLRRFLAASMQALVSRLIIGNVRGKNLSTLEKIESGTSHSVSLGTWHAELIEWIELAPEGEG
jgi:hypothetical protein